MISSQRCASKAGPVDVVLDGTVLLADSIDAEISEPVPQPLFPDRSAREGRFYKVNPDDTKVSITLHFAGREAVRAREIVARLFNHA